VFVGAWPRAISAWNVQGAAALVRTLQCDADPVAIATAGSTTSLRLYAVLADGSAHEWRLRNTRSAQSAVRLARDRVRFRSQLVSETGEQWFLGGDDGAVYVWRTNALNRPPYGLAPQAGAITALASDATSRVLYVATSTGAVQMWLATPGPSVYRLTSERRARPSAAAPVTALVAARYAHRVYWTLDAHSEIFSSVVGSDGLGRVDALAAHTAPVTAIALSYDGALLASAAQDGTICVCSAPQLRVVQTLTVASTVRSLALPTNARRLYAGHDDGTVSIWEMPRFA
jgi:cytochrome c